jgi:hypothetical protein
MEKKFTQQEILLVTGTSFTTRNFCEKNENDFNFQLTEKEKLEVACWNGMLPFMLPEIIIKAPGLKLYLWEIREASSFLKLELGEYYMDFENRFSINPYAFVPTIHLS